MQIYLCDEVMLSCVVGNSAYLKKKQEKRFTVLGIMTKILVKIFFVEYLEKYKIWRARSLKLYDRALLTKLT